jgi:hypothetical protein
LQKYRTIARLFIGALLPDRAQQEYSSDAISNRSLNQVSVGIWWIFGWRRKNLLGQVFTMKMSPAWACAGHWAALGDMNWLQRRIGKEAG